MSHIVQGFIGKLEELGAAARLVVPDAALAPLNHGFGLLIVGEWFDGNQDQLIPPHFTDIGERLSQITPVAYVCTEYFGGDGHQWSAAWDKGHLLLAPERSDWAINDALASLGVSRTTLGAQVMDQFDALGLGKYRSNEEWISNIHSIEAS